MLKDISTTAVRSDRTAVVELFFNCFALEPGQPYKIVNNKNAT